jgi:tetratricopeptide (TPR) repeat protein
MTAIDPRADPVRQIDQARRLYEAGELDAAAALFAELATTEGTHDRAQAALGLAVVAERMAEDLLAEGRPDEAADVVLQALEVTDAPRLRVLLGIAHLEMACAEFAAAVEAGPDADTAALAIELLARTLPLRGRDGDAETVWRYGFEHADDTLAAQVRQRYDRP